MSIINNLFYTWKLRNADDFGEFASRMKQEFKLQELIRKEEMLQGELREQTKDKVFKELVVDQFAWKKHPLLMKKDKEILPHPDSWKSESVSRIRPKSEVVCQSIQPLLPKFTPPKPTGIDLRSLLHIGAPTEKFDIADLNLKEAESVQLFEVPDFQSSRVEFWIEPIIKRANTLHVLAKSPTTIPERIGFESAGTNVDGFRSDGWKAHSDSWKCEAVSRISPKSEMVCQSIHPLSPKFTPPKPTGVDLRSLLHIGSPTEKFDIAELKLKEAERVQLFEVPDFQRSRIEFLIEPIIKRANKLHVSANSPTSIPERMGFESARTNVSAVQPDEWKATALEIKKSSRYEEITCALENIDFKSIHSDENEMQPFGLNSINLTEANICKEHDEIAFNDNDDFVEVDISDDMTGNDAPEKKQRRKRVVDRIRNFWNGLFVCGKRVILKD